MNKEKTVLFITTRLPFPTTSGRKTSLYNYCKIIKKQGYKLVVASFDDNYDLKLKPDFIDELLILSNTNKITKLCNILKYSFITRKYPLQVSLYYDKKIKQKINEIVKKINPQIVIADMVRTTEYLKDIENVIKVADLDDRLSLRYKRQLECDINEVNPYGLFLNSLPKFIQRTIMMNFVKKTVMKNEIKLLEKYELNIGKTTDYTVFVAENETNSFNSELGENKAITIPIGVDIEYYKNIEDINAVKNNYIGFLGVLNVSHNENAVKRFIKDILPLVLEKNYDAKFIVIGGGATEELLSLKNESVIFMGRVEDVRNYLRKCKVFVSPLSFGSGIKTKNLEAMSLGIPVITTSIGAENINAIDKKDWYIENENSKIASRICELLNDSKKAYEIGKNGSNYVSNNFTWKVSEENFKKILK